MKVLLFLFVFLFSTLSCKNENIDKYIPLNFSNILVEIANIETISDSIKQVNRTTQLFDSLNASHKIPWISNDTIVFLYSGEASKIQLAGDMTAWRIQADYEFKKIGKSKVWYLMKTFPRTARLDYKIIVNGSWSLDSNNSNKQLSGFGYNSAFYMPDYKPSVYLLARNNIEKGKISEAITISSSSINRPVRYWVYIPAGYENLNNLPSMYVLDGQEYKYEGMGSMINVLDNMIAEKLIKPIVVIFVDPVHPVSSSNQRVELFLNNANYASFFKNELIPAIDKSFKTENNPNQRAILGTSYGGNCATYFGLQIPEVFKLIAPQSPSFNSNIISLYTQTNLLNFNKVFITTGVINDTESYANQLEQILISKKVPYQYIKVNEGHSWGNWSALLDDILLYFYGK